MGYSDSRYAKYQYATVTYAWNAFGLALDLTDSIGSTDSLSYLIASGYFDSVSIQEWFSIKLESSSAWTTSPDAVTTWIATTPATNSWTQQP